MRYLDETLTDLAETKLVLLTGPRQVGKTTIAEHWLKGRRGIYLNYDVPEDRDVILRREFIDPVRYDAVVLDEIHKFARWKTLLKGVVDQRRHTMKMVVTGSARLDVFQRGGDSLLGRHEYLCLHPFSVGELLHGKLLPPPANWLTPGDYAGGKKTEKLWQRLANRSGFPEPYTKNDTKQHQRWSLRRRSLLVRDDLRELSQIRELSLVEHLAMLLPARVGSPLSINSLREELSVAHDTVSSWIETLERLYYCFRISPYSARIGRSVRKEKKLYLWDWSVIESPSARFENMVASHLLKAIHGWTDVGFGEFDLCYFRDRDSNEVDFVITEKRKPIAILECKKSDTSPSKPLLRLARELHMIPAIQLVELPNIDRTDAHFRVVSAHHYLANFP